MTKFECIIKENWVKWGKILSVIFTKLTWKLQENTPNNKIYSHMTTYALHKPSVDPIQSSFTPANHPHNTALKSSSPKQSACPTMVPLANVWVAFHVNVKCDYHPKLHGILLTWIVYCCDFMNYKMCNWNSSHRWPWLNY